MARVVWSNRAAREFEDLILYLKPRNRDAAVRAAREIRLLTRLLARRPLLGRIGTRDGTREFSLARWHKVIVYRESEDGIEISTLRDPRMQLKQDDTDA